MEDSIKEMYDDAEIFITGGSGVVGKALIEKLLRSLKVRRIFLLLRPKKNLDVQQRLETLKKAKIFMRVLKEQPDCFDKVEGIAGDVLYPRLGISDEDLARLQNVTLFYHSAATVRFDEPLKLALTVNVGGTHEALLLAEKLKKLKMFMHVSTFYSNPYLNHTEEKVYPSPWNWKFALERLKEDIPEEMLEALCKKIIVGFPNTYSFTKNLTESLVNDFRHRLPVCIYRPSIVVHALQEPEPGFPSALMGALGLFTLAACGLLKSVYVGKGIKLDMTPLDLCAKAMLYYTIRARRVYDEVPAVTQAPVYIVSSDKLLEFSFKDMGEMMMNENIWIDYATEKNVLIPWCDMTHSRFRYMVSVFLKQIPAAIFGDLLLRLLNHKPLIMSMVRRCFVTLQVMDPFRTNEFTCNGITHYKEMLAETKDTIFDSSKDIDKLKTYEGILSLLRDMTMGIRTHLLNENPATIPRSKRIVQMKIWFYNIVRCVCFYFAFMWVYHNILLT